MIAILSENHQSSVPITLFIVPKQKNAHLPSSTAYQMKIAQCTVYPHHPQEVFVQAVPSIAQFMEIVILFVVVQMHVVEQQSMDQLITSLPYFVKATGDVIHYTYMQRIHHILSLQWDH